MKHKQAEHTNKRPRWHRLGRVTLCLYINLIGREICRTLKPVGK